MSRGLCWRDVFGYRSYAGIRCREMRNVAGLASVSRAPSGGMTGACAAADRGAAWYSLSFVGDPMR